MRRHVLVSLIAAVSTFVAVNPALAQTTGTPLETAVTTPIEAPAPIEATENATVSNVVLGIGAEESEANVVWLTKNEAEGQELQFGPADQVTAETLAAQGEIVAATSTVVNIATGTSKDEVKNKTAATSVDMGRHTATITGLQPNSSYIYRVGSDTTGWSEVKTFYTEDFDQDWNFVFLGDPQLGSGGHSVEQSQAMWTENVSKVMAAAPGSSFIQSAGDQLQLGNLQEHTALTAAPEMQSMQFAPINGNHDNYDFESFQAFYSRPNVGDDGRNYFYEYNNILMVTLDTNHIDDLAADATFVQNVITNHGADKDWVMVTFHHAPYSQANHQDDDTIAKLRAELVPELSDMGVDLVLSGHDHIYTRSHLVKGNTPVLPNVLAKPGDAYQPADDETMYLTANSVTGTKFYHFYKDGQDFENMTREEAQAQGLVQEYTAYWEQKYNGNFTNVKVSGDELTVVTVDIETGDQVDSFTLQKSAGTDLSVSVEKLIEGSTSKGLMSRLMALMSALGAAGTALLQGFFQK